MKQIMVHKMNVKKTYIALPVILLGFVLSAVQQAQGELKTETISGKISGDEITFDIYLPEGTARRELGIRSSTTCMVAAVPTKEVGHFVPP